MSPGFERCEIYEFEAIVFCKMKKKRSEEMQTLHAGPVL